MIFLIPMDSTYFSSPVFGGVRVAHLVSFYVVIVCVFTCCIEFRVVMSVTISA